MNTATHTLDVLILITNILNDFGVSIIMRSAEIYAMKSNNKIFKELVNFINDSNIDIKLNSLNLICDMLEKCTDKIKVNFFLFICIAFPPLIFISFNIIVFIIIIFKRITLNLNYNISNLLSNYVNNYNYTCDIRRKRYICLFVNLFVSWFIIFYLFVYFENSEFDLNFALLKNKIEKQIAGCFGRCAIKGDT